MIEDLRGPLAQEPITAKQFPPGFAGTLFTTTWQGLEIDGFEVPESADGIDFVTLNVQVPLKQRGIQLKFFGKAEKKADLQELMRKTLDGLKGETNWHPPNSFAALRGQSHYGKLLLVAALLLIVGGLTALWLISRATPKGSVLVIAAIVYAASYGFGEIRVREVVMLAGALRMLGFAGAILGIVDLIRGRKRRTDTSDLANGEIKVE
jgi:hypothetical protein